jgi:hypothetical protein
MNRILILIIGFLSFWLVGTADIALSQEKRPLSKTLYLTVGSTVPLQMTSKKPIRLVINEREQIALVRPLLGDPTTVLVTGLAPGWTRITLVDTDGNKEIREMGKRSEKK